MTAFAEVFGGWALLILGGLVADRKRKRRLAPSLDAYRQARDECDAYKEANPLPLSMAGTLANDAKQIAELEEELEELNARERSLSFQLGLAGRQEQRRERPAWNSDDEGPAAGGEEVAGDEEDDGPSAGP